MTKKGGMGRNGFRARPSSADIGKVLSDQTISLRVRLPSPPTLTADQGVSLTPLLLRRNIVP